jgi:hypothetical protein
MRGAPTSRPCLGADYSGLGPNTCSASWKDRVGQKESRPALRCTGGQLGTAGPNNIGRLLADLVQRNLRLT